MIAVPPRPSRLSMLDLRPTLSHLAPRPLRVAARSSVRRRAPAALLLSLALLAACGSGNEATPASTPDPNQPLSAAEKLLSPEELLGKRLFEDTNLSEPAGQACASCHAEDLAFQGNAGSAIPAVAQGSRPEALGDRNVPTAMYALFSPPFALVEETTPEGEIEYVPTGGQFWDGRADSLAEQAKGPFLNPREMNNPSARAVVDKVAAGPYARLAATVWGDGTFADTDATYERIAQAIAAFERTERFRPFRSKFDDVLRGKAVFTEAEARGFELFKDAEKGNCLACHVGDEESNAPEDWLFTDFTYDNLGVPRNAAIPDTADPTWFDLGLCRQDGLENKVPAEFDVESLCGAFKVPTLRNITRTGPYMHNGFFSTLRDVVRFYVTRDTSPELWYPAHPDGTVAKFDDLPAAFHDNVNTTEAPYDRQPGEEPRLTGEEIDAVVAFLETLTDR